MDTRQMAVCGRKHKHKTKDTAENHIVALVLSGKANEGDMEAYAARSASSGTSAMRRQTATKGEIRMRNANPTFGSLFSGAGGFDMGFHASGFKCLWTAENDKFAANVLAKLGAPNLGDVRNIDGERLAAPDVVVWGSPCQDLSHANRARTGLKGDKSKLFYEGIRIINPLLRRGTRFSVWENVAGCLSRSSTEDFRKVLLAFLELGAVDLGWRVLDARHFGVPQARRRVFVVADFGGRGCGEILRYAEAGPVLAQEVESDGLDIHGPSISGTLTARNPARQGRPDQIVTHWAIKAQKPSNEGSPGYMMVHPCLTTSHIRSVIPRSILTHSTLLARKPYDENLRGSTMIPDQGRLRWRTPRESERLMGWPDDWTATGADGTKMSDVARYRMTGNGVVTPVAKFIADGIASVMGVRH